MMRMPHFAARPAALVFPILALLLPVLAVSAEDREAAAEKIAQLRRRLDAQREAQVMDVLAAQPNEADRVDATLIAGAFYELGMIGDPDAVKAASFFRLAAERGLAEADCALGNIYSTGAQSSSGRIERDMAKALSHYERAAAGGSVKAMLDLGMMYTDGVEGVPRDGKKAMAYLMDAARRGNETALERLEPVMKGAREWEAARPGRKANFPTRREDIILPDLVKAEAQRNDRLNKIAERVYREINERIARE